MLVQESDVTCSFTQKVTELNGDCASEHQKFHVVGKIEGSKIEWSYKTEYKGELIAIAYEGEKQSEYKITGTAHVSELSLDGDFAATKD